MRCDVIDDARTQMLCDVWTLEAKQIHRLAGFLENRVNPQTVLTAFQQNRALAGKDNDEGMKRGGHIYLAYGLGF